MPFKPGESGNPATQFKPGVQPPGAGKPKGSKHINTWVQEILNDENFEAWIYDAKEGVKKHEGIPLPAIIKAQVIKAMSGDTKAYDALIKSGWAQKTETELHVKELPKPLLGGVSVLPSDNSDKEDIKPSKED